MSQAVARASAHARRCPDLALVARIERARHAAAALLGDLEGVGSVLIASSDGDALAHAGRLPVEPDRLAARAVALATLGEAAVREACVGPPRCLVVESAEGRIVVRRLRVADADLVAVLVTDQRLLLGLVRSRIAQLEQALQDD